MARGEGRDQLDVAVVGGGLSGLCAARRLRARGRTVVVVEARDRVGGKMCTDMLGGHHADLGAHWIGPTQDRVAALARELGVRTAPQPLEGRAVLVARGRRRTFRGSIPPLSPLSIAELGVAQLRLDRLRKKVSVDQPWMHADTTDWDTQTVDTFARRYLHTRDARMFLNLAAELVFGAEIEELSLLYFLFYLASGGGLTSLTEFEGGAQQDHFVGGSQQLCERLADGSAAICGCAPRWPRSSRTVTVSCCAPGMERLFTRDTQSSPSRRRSTGGGTGRAHCRPTATSSRSACPWAHT